MSKIYDENRQIDQFFEQIQIYEEKLKQKDDSLLDLQAELSLTKKSLQNQETQIQNQASNINLVAQNSKKSYEEEITNLRTQMLHNTNKLNEEIIQLKNQEELLQKKCLKIEGEKKKLEASCKSLKEKVLDYEFQIEKKTEQINNSIDEYELKIGELHSQLRMANKLLKSQTEDYQNKISLLECQLQDEVSRSRETNQQNKLQKKNTETYMMLTLEEEAQIQQLKDKISEQAEILYELEETFLIKIDDKSKIKLINEGFQLKLNALEQEKQNIIDKLVERARVSELKIEELEEQIKELEEKDDEMPISTSSENELEHLKAENKKLKNEVFDLNELIKKQTRRTSVRRDSTLQFGMDILALQREINESHLKERDLLLEQEKLIKEITQMKTHLLLRQAEMEGKIQIFQAEANHALKEQQYAEDVAQRAQLRLAQISSEKDQNYFVFRKTKKELEAYQKQFGKLKK